MATKTRNSNAGQESQPDGRKLAEIVAHEIERDVIARGWPIGEVLGTEAELLKRYRVSRAVFREAVRIVEHHQVAKMRRGPGGGLVVTPRDINTVVQSVALQLEYEDMDPARLYEARTILEVASVRLAAEGIDEDGAARLREYLGREEVEVGKSFTEQTHHFHILVAELSGNPALRLFVHVLGRLTGVQSARPRSLKKATKDVHEAHLRIAEAIIDGDPDQAERRMRRHLDAVKDWLQPRKNSWQDPGQQAAFVWNS